MQEIDEHDLQNLKSAYTEDRRLGPSIAKIVGGKCIASGYWRFFGCEQSSAGVKEWNDAGGWRSAWEGFLEAGMHCFGEDVFGNQIISVHGCENALLWHHENGEIHDLYTNPIELIEIVASNGVEWIDFYGDGCLEIAASFGLPPINSHLHWTTPQILGGIVSMTNLSIVERQSHLTGHGKLWAQIGNARS